MRTPFSVAEACISLSGFYLDGLRNLRSQQPISPLPRASHPKEVVVQEIFPASNFHVFCVVLVFKSHKFDVAKKECRLFIVESFKTFSKFAKI